MMRQFVFAAACLAAPLLIGCSAEPQPTPPTATATVAATNAAPTTPPPANTPAATTTAPTAPSVGSVLAGVTKVKVHEGKGQDSAGKPQGSEFEITAPADVAALLKAIGTDAHADRGYPRSLCFNGTSFTFYDAAGKELANLRKSCDGFASDLAVLTWGDRAGGFSMADSMEVASIITRARK